MGSFTRDTEDIFSPLDGDVSLQTALSDRTGLISPREPPASFHEQREDEYESSLLHTQYDAEHSTSLLNGRLEAERRQSFSSTDYGRENRRSLSPSQNYVEHRDLSSQTQRDTEYAGPFLHAHHEPQNMNSPNVAEYTIPTRPRPMSIPRKPIGNYQPLPRHVSTRSLNTLHSVSTFDTVVNEKIEGKDVVVRRGWRFYGTFACLAVLNFISAIDATILSVALPTIASDLKGTTAIQAFWCGTSFLLTSTVFQPSWASFSHIIGRKPVLLCALAVFTLGSIICSVSYNIATLLAGRSVQGIGGGGLVSLTYVIVADMVPLKERGKWFSIISLQWAVGTIIGPIIGGEISEKTNWRWIFWLNLPFCVIGGIGVPICLRLHNKEGSIREKLRNFDWFGSVLFVAATTSFLIPLTWGGVMYSWGHWRTLVPLLLGVLGLLFFVVYSVCYSKEPLIRRSLFNSPTAIQAYFGTMIHGMLVWGLLYYMPIYFEVAKNYSPILSGVAIFPFTFTTAPAAVVIGLIIARTGRYRPSLWSGWFLTTLGIGLLVYLKVNTGTAAWVCISLVAGSGMGILFSAQGFAAQASASNADLPFAGAMYSFFRSLGQTIGVAIAGVIFQNTFKKKILTTAYAPAADAWSKDASALVGIVKAMSSIGDEGLLKVLLVKTYVESLRMVWVVLCVLAGVAFLTSVVFTAELSLDRELETDQGFVYGDAKSRRRDEEQDLEH